MLGSAGLGAACGVSCRARSVSSNAGCTDVGQRESVSSAVMCLYFCMVGSGLHGLAQSVGTLKLGKVGLIGFSWFGLFL